MKPFKSLKSAVFFSKHTLKVSWVVILLLFSLTRNGIGQTLTRGLLFTPKENKELYDPAQVLAAPNVCYSEQEKKQFKKRLLERVEETLFNLEDDSTGLAEDYETIWGEQFLKKLKNELIQLRTYLKEPNGPLDWQDFSKPFCYVPHPHALEELLKETVDRIEKKPLVPQNEFVELNVIKKDLLNKYLLERYTSSLRYDTPPWEQGIDIQYIKEWREIEKAYEDLKKIYKEVLSVKADIFSYDHIKTTQWKSEAALINLPDNGVVQRIKHSRFIRKWLWYTGGIINMNPLLVTSKSNRYPPGEKNSFFTPEKKRLQDSLNKMPVLDYFRQSEYVFNRIHLPLPSFGEKSLRFNLVEYDARQNYKTRNLSDEKYLTNGEQLKIAIYNIPAGATVSAQYKEDKLLMESNAIKQLNAFADQISVITSLGLAQKTAFANVMSLLNPAGLPQVQSRGVNTSTDTEKKIDLKSTNPKLSSFHMMMEGSEYLELKAEDYSKQRKLQVKIEDQIVPLTGTDREEDKRRILWGSTVADFKNTDLVFLDKAVEAFIRKSRAFFLDYSNESSLVKTAKQLQDSFIYYLNTDLNNHISAIDMLLKDIEGKIKKISPFVRIYNRSLPEVNLEAAVDTAARHYTKLIVPEIPVAPKIFKYTLTEERVKSPAREVAQKEFKVIRSLRFDFSVGLGINLGPSYTISHSSGGALPVTDQGNQFQFVAGGHWYVIKKLNKLNDRFLGSPEERFSVYGGLSIQKALDNYYLGVSYDLWPGVRLIGAAHLYRNQSFKIINNAVAKKASGIEWAAPFISINVEPATLGKTIGLFK